MNWFESGTATRKLFDSLSEFRFWQLDSLRSLELKQTTIAYKVRPSLKTLTLSKRPLVELPFGEAFALHCDAIVIGYLFLVPKCNLTVLPHAVTFQRKPTILPEVKRYVIANELCVLGNSDALAVVTRNTTWTKSKDVH